MSSIATPSAGSGGVGSVDFGVPAGATFLQDVVFAVMSLRIKQQHAEVTRLITDQQNQLAIQQEIRKRIEELNKAATDGTAIPDGAKKFNFVVDAGGNVQRVTEPGDEYFAATQYEDVPLDLARGGVNFGGPGAFGNPNQGGNGGSVKLPTHDKASKAEINTEIERLRGALETYGSESELTMTRIGMFMNALGTSQTALSQMLKTIDEQGDLLARNLGP